MPKFARPTAAIIQQAAELRVRGNTWDAVGQTLNRKSETVRNWQYAYAEEWNAAIAHALRELAAEATAESVLTLRRQLRLEDDKASRAAADTLLKHTTKARPARKQRRPTVRNSARSVPMIAFVEGLTDDEVASHLRELAPPPRPAAPDAVVAASDLGGST